MAPGSGRGSFASAVHGAVGVDNRPTPGVRGRPQHGQLRALWDTCREPDPSLGTDEPRVKWVRWHRRLTWIDLLRRALSTVTAVTLPTTNTRLTAVRTGAQKRSALPGVTFWITSVGLLA